LVVFVALAELICRAGRLAPPPDPGFAFYVESIDADVPYAFMRFDPDMLWTPREGFVGTGRWAGVRINSAGFRDVEYRVNKPPGAVRIVAMSDSCTFGFGVHNNMAYHALLERQLNAAAARGRSFEVINAGVTGYTSAQCLAAYCKKIRPYRPDVVTLMVGANDVRRHCAWTDRQVMALVRPNWLTDVDHRLEGLHGYRALRYAIRGRARTEGDPVPRVPIDDYRWNIAELDRLCRADGARLVLISFPVNAARPFVDAETYLNGAVRQYRCALEELAASGQVPLLTVVDLTERATDPSPELFVDRVHPSERGHELLMRHLYGLLVAESLLPG
jgi:lysophospholipase L1-like esterase